MLKNISRIGGSLLKNKQLVSATKYGVATNKIYATAEEAVADVKSGNSILLGGFGLCGIPENTIAAIDKRKDLKDLIAISNDPGTPDFGLGFWFHSNKIKRFIGSYIGTNPEYEIQYISGNVELQLCPQGTLAEKIRSGAAGIPAFWTPTGAGTLVEQGGMPIKFKPGTGIGEIVSEPKERRIINGRAFILEESIKADFALVKAHKADTKGNLTFYGTANNFNEDMAKNAKITIAEVEEIVEAGQLDPNHIRVPGCFVHRIIKGNFEKRIEKLMLNRGLSQKQTFQDDNKRKAYERREKIIKRAAKEINTGMYVNLGVGIPTLLPRYLPPEMEIWIHTENGALGMGDYPKPGFHDPDLINAGKETITLKLGASLFSSSQSFGIVRGSHLGMTVLGAMQVSETGDIASWLIPGKKAKGMGGSMDLVSSGVKVMALMQHTEGGSKKVLNKCKYPITGEGVLSMVITDKAVFEYVPNGKGGKKMILKEIADDTTLEFIRQSTTANFEVAEPLLKF